MTDPAPLLASLNVDAAATARLEHLDRAELGGHVVDRYALGNGLELVLWPDPVAPVFAFQTWFRVGSRHEKPGKTGIAHLFEHLMFKATENLAEGEFDKIMEDHGAQTNAATWVDWTYYREKLPAGNLDLCFKMEADRMEHMILNSEQLESEREVVCNERLLRVDNDPEGKMNETLYAMAWDEHPYRWPTIGWMEDIKAITLEDCLEFDRLYYAPNNAVVVIVGDFQVAEALALAQRYYGHMASQPVPTEVVVSEPPLDEERRATLELPVAAAKVQIGWRAIKATDPLHAAMEVMCEVLVGTESSRLHKRLVTDMEVASEITGWTPNLALVGLFEISAQLMPGRSIEEVEGPMLEEIERLVVELVSERELAKACNGLEAYYLRRMADVGSRARGVGLSAISTGDYAWYLRRAEAIRAVTVQDIMAISKRIFGSPRAVVEAIPKAAA